ncbi:MAG: ribose 5-phosphate isomerase B [Bacteroidetes bacterium]|nr:ribose 5-phosphate isomerase B [Bacteroidota bacterium]MCW5895285.1 ribose 5-phosphate isomerase B [Bacteroidota bacterium]
MNVPKEAIITPLARELALAKGIEFSSSAEHQPAFKTPESVSPTLESSSKKNAVVAFGSDHGGFQLKEQLKKHAEGLGYKVLDVGTSNEEPCDYPDFAYAVAQAVSSGEAWRGVMIDGAGIGSCVVANKVPGVKAACCHNEFVARNAREHNDTNVLTLGSRVVGSEVCKEILKIWLETWFSGGRHKQRVEKIDEVETRFLKRN